MDCGHGKHDPGFVVGNVKEKDINLQIGLKTAQVLKQKGYDVFLTRDKDTFLALDMRTTQTNKQPKIDLFVSIHTNADQSQKTSGIETFCVQPSLFKHELKVMNTNDHKTHKVETRTLHSKSRKLAMAVQAQLLTHARQHNKQVVDRKVKYQPAQVLMGLESPAILVELGFLSHPGERRLLQSDSYQKSLAQGIYKGIETFLQ